MMRAVLASLLLAVPAVLLAQAPARSAGVNEVQPDGSTPLRWAAYHGDAQAAATLLKPGARPNLVTDTGMTPLALACESGNAEIVRLLLDAGENPNLANDGASGRLEADRHLAYASRTVPTGHLRVSILDMFNVGVDNFQNSTGRRDGV
jgi:ankyrin repeat protein